MINPATLILGPLLGVESDTDFTICVLLNLEKEVTPDLIQLELDNNSYDAAHVERVGSYYFLRFEVVIPPDPLEDLSHTYQITYNQQRLVSSFGMDSFTFWVTSASSMPKVAFASCSGFHDKYPDQNDTESYRGWEKMSNLKIDILVLTGDQVYADTLWKKFWLARISLFLGRFFLKRMHKDFERFYLQLYIDSWSNRAMAIVLATIPNIMAWDDHDIIDGYGSHPKNIQQSKLLNGIFKIASGYYELFQLRTKKNKSLIDINYDYTGYFTFRNFSFILPDTRSKRTRENILEEAGYTLLESINNSLVTSSYRYYEEKKNMNVICFVLPVPIAHRNYNTDFEKFFTITSGILLKLWPGTVRLSIDDDLVDHWDHEEHTTEQERMLNLIFDFGKKHEPYSVIIASGDVHSAGAASVVKCDNAVCQIISSPMVNDPMSGLIKWIGKYTAKDKNLVGTNLITNLKSFGNSSEAIFTKRNFMTVSGSSKEKNPADVKPVVNDEEPNVGDKNLVKKSPGRLTIALFQEPWTDEPLYRTVNRFTKN